MTYQRCCTAICMLESSIPPIILARATDPSISGVLCKLGHMPEAQKLSQPKTLFCSQLKENTCGRFINLPDQKWQ